MTIVAIDQGTTSTRAFRFDREGRPQAQASRELAQTYPAPGWVEQDPEQIWADSLAVLRAVIDDSVVAIGIANQRETVILWDRATGAALHNAIVWQDRRTAELCAKLHADGLEPMIQAKTGLLLDAYFSASKIKWLLDTLPDARRRAERGELAVGTVDSFLLWRLTGGRVHATDITNASRTMLYDITARDWDGELLRLFDIPAAILPQVHANDHHFGDTADGLLDKPLPISGMAGDQQAALIGQRCFTAGMVKATYGTGCFLLGHIGEKHRLSDHRLLTTPAYAIGGQIAYAQEGSIFVAGSAINWLRDGLGVIASAEATAALAATLPYDHGVHFVPAFVGLGAPYWRSDVRAMLSGIGFDTGPAHLARAALEAAVFQTCDLIDCIGQSAGARPGMLRIDGGMATNDWLAQFLADMIEAPVERPEQSETTAAGAALLAGLGIGLWTGIDALPPLAKVRRFDPVPLPIGKQLRTGWADAVSAALRAGAIPALPITKVRKAPADTGVGSGAHRGI